MISNTDSTLLVYSTEHMLVKAYKDPGAVSGFSQRASGSQTEFPEAVRCISQQPFLPSELTNGNLATFSVFQRNWLKARRP